MLRISWSDYKNRVFTHTFLKRIVDCDVFTCQHIHQHRLEIKTKKKLRKVQNCNYLEANHYKNLNSFRRNRLETPINYFKCSSASLVIKELKFLSYLLTTELLVAAAAHLLSGDISKFCMIPSSCGHRSLARSDVERSQDITRLEMDTT